MSKRREQKPIEGVIADVSEPAVHSAGGYRVRFKLNGVLTDRYRSDKKEAETLAAELNKRAQAANAGISLAPTWLNPSQLKQAELSFQILANSKLVRP